MAIIPRKTHSSSREQDVYVHNIDAHRHHHKQINQMNNSPPLNNGSKNPWRPWPVQTIPTSRHQTESGEESGARAPQKQKHRNRRRLLKIPKPARGKLEERGGTARSELDQNQRKKGERERERERAGREIPNLSRNRWRIRGPPPRERAFGRGEF
jgi:hypothetical protein